MAGNFGGLLKICHLAKFTLVVESVLAIMIFIAQWLIERTGNLTGPWARRNRWLNATQNWANRCYLTLDCFRPVGLYSDRVHVIWTTFLALTDKPTLSFGVQNSSEKRCPRTQLSKVNSMSTIRLARLAAGLVHKLWFCNNDDIPLWSFGGWNIGGLLSEPPIRQNKFPARIFGHTVYEMSQ